MIPSMIKSALMENTLLICDETKPIAIAGVMGGANSEITEDTKVIVLNPPTLTASVRRTATSIGMRTESSASI